MGQKGTQWTISLSPVWGKNFWFAFCIPDLLSQVASLFLSTSYSFRTPCTTKSWTILRLPVLCCSTVEIQQVRGVLLSFVLSLSHFSHKCYSVYSGILFLSQSILLGLFLYQIIIKWSPLYKALFSKVVIIIQLAVMNTITFRFI